MNSSIYAGFVAVALGLVSLGPPMVASQVLPQRAADVTVRRFAANPIITPDLSPGIGINIQGPSLIRVPEWIPNPLGKYYLYFADHKGSYIRLAYADELAGPWTIHERGALHLEQSHFSTDPARVPPEVQEEIRLGGWAPGPIEGVPDRLDSATKPHLASPDVHVREDRREIVMYFHGLADFRFQRTRVATSKDGIHFEANEPLVSRSYHRGFQHQGQWYAMSMPGIFSRSKDGISDFEAGEVRLFPSTMRHSALLKRGNVLYVFWSRVGDTPEHILLSRVDISGDWSTWSSTDPVSVIHPVESWEGADRPSVPSVRDAINVRVNQLRDPAIFEENGRTYLLYSVAGEAGIAIAEIEIPEDQVVAVVDAFHAALSAGDSVAALSHLADDVRILESGRVEDKEHYRSGHLAGDMRFAGAVPPVRSEIEVTLMDDVAWAHSTSVRQGRIGDREIDSQGAELVVLAREGGTWKIKAIHWSSRQRR
jgi:ketosteroid isomerase-like protein